MADQSIDSETLYEETEVEEGLFESQDEDFEALNDSLEGEDEAELILDAPPHPLGRSMVIDFANGGLVRQGRSPMTVRGESNLQAWIEKCLRTHQGAHPIHPPGYGVETPIGDFLGTSIEDLDTGDLEDVVREALTFHPAIVDIENFEVGINEEDPDSPFGEITFDVVRDNDTRESIDVALTDSEVFV